MNALITVLPPLYFAASSTVRTRVELGCIEKPSHESHHLGLTARVTVGRRRPLEKGIEMSVWAED